MIRSSSACEAGESVKPGALAPGRVYVLRSAREHGRKLFKRISTSIRPFHGLNQLLFFWPWGLHPRLYAAACFAGCVARNRKFSNKTRPSRDSF